VHGVFLRPHPPIIAPEPYNAMYDPATVPMPRRAATPDAESAQHPYLAYALKAMAEIGAYNEHYPHNLLEIDDTELRQLRATYYGMITQVDDQIGRLITHLKKTGEYDHTLIIFTCDHGEMLGDHWLWGKPGYFDEAFHIPLVIRDPRVAADDGRGRVVEEFTEAVDLMPTSLTGSASNRRRNATAARCCRSSSAVRLRTGGRRCIGNTTSATSSISIPRAPSSRQRPVLPQRHPRSSLQVRALRRPGAAVL